MERWLVENSGVVVTLVLLVLVVLLILGEFGLLPAIF